MGDLGELASQSFGRGCGEAGEGRQPRRPSPPSPQRTASRVDGPRAPAARRGSASGPPREASAGHRRSALLCIRSGPSAVGVRSAVPRTLAVAVKGAGVFAAIALSAASPFDCARRKRARSGPRALRRSRGRWRGRGPAPRGARVDCRPCNRMLLARGREARGALRSLGLESLVDDDALAARIQPRDVEFASTSVSRTA